MRLRNLPVKDKTVFGNWNLFIRIGKYKARFLKLDFKIIGPIFSWFHFQRYTLTLFSPPYQFFPRLLLWFFDFFISSFNPFPTMLSVLNHWKWTKNTPQKDVSLVKFSLKWNFDNFFLWKCYSYQQTLVTRLHLQYNLSQLMSKCLWSGWNW